MVPVRRAAGAPQPARMGAPLEVGPPPASWRQDPAAATACGRLRAATAVRKTGSTRLASTTVVSGDRGQGSATRRRRRASP